MMAREAHIVKVNPYDLHGVRWYQLFLAYTDNPGVVSEVRLSHDVVYPEPTDGDKVSVDSILSIVTEVKKAP
jgi:hypothetical protein